MLQSDFDKELDGMLLRTEDEWNRTPEVSILIENYGRSPRSEGM